MTLRLGASGLGPDRFHSNLWSPDPGTLALWERLRPGVSVTIVKRDPHGVETARYPGTVSNDPVASPWRTLIATWTMHEVWQGELAFTPGDTLHECFSPKHPFNAFAVTSPAGLLKGWYANVTWPTLLEESADGLVLIWRDLILDIVVLPTGSVTFLDEHEMTGSGIEREDPDLARAIVAARDHLADLATRDQPPFLNPTQQHREDRTASSDKADSGNQ